MGAWRQALLILLFVLLIRAPFLNQAIQGDDIYYLAGAQHALIDPAHPTHAKYMLQGEVVDMRGHPHPPLNSWTLAALLALWGDVYEVRFHAVYALFTLIAAGSMWWLARRRLKENALLATLLFLATPALVVNGNSLEADVPFLAFWMATVALFVKAVDQRSLGWLSAAVGAAVLAAMTAYQAIVLTAVLGAYLWLEGGEGRRWKAAWVATLAAPATVASFQLFERVTGGALPATVLAGYFSTYGLQQLANKVKNAASLTGHLGWVVFPVLSGLVFRRMWWVGLGAAAAGLLFADSHPLYWISAGVGAAVLAGCAREWRRFEGAWVVIYFAAALVLFFAGAARYLLPLAAPVALLAAERLPRRTLVGGLVAQTLLGLALAWVNYEHWDGYRRFAASLAERMEGRRTWVNAEWGLRFYLEAQGGLPLGRGQAVYPGDLVVGSELSYPLPVTTGGGQLVELAKASVSPVAPLRLIGLDSRSGYSTVSMGLRPFGLTDAPVDRVSAATVIERKPEVSWLAMNAPQAAFQIVSGLHDVEPGGWRWTAEEVAVLLAAPAEAKKLTAEIYVPDSVPARRVELLVDGVVVLEKKLDKAGVAYRLETEGVYRSGTVGLRVDRTLTPAGDHRKLGVVLSGIGYR